VIIVMTLIASAIGALAGLIVPLVVAAIVGTLAVPLVDRLEAARIPRRAGAVAVMVLLVGVFVGAFVIAAKGIADQSGEIRVEVANGLSKLGDWIDELDLDGDDPAQRYDDLVELGRKVLPGAASYLATIFNGVLSFLIGSALSLFILYYLLADWSTITRWVGRHLGVPADIGMGIIDDTATVLRRNFSALTVSSLIVAAIIGTTMWILGLPLAFTVTLVTFLTSYVPYVGAVVSGAFGFLVALGAGDTNDAFVLLVVILIAQNLVQTIVGNKLTSDQLSIHPLPAFLVTLVGASVAGLFGAILATPLLAVALAVIRRTRATRAALG
jgi:predicted PurR-regulated permease PerM